MTRKEIIDIIFALAYGFTMGLCMMNTVSDYMDNLPTSKIIGDILASVWWMACLFYSLHQFNKHD